MNNNKKNTWITSDHHFFHKNILMHCPVSRPFNTVEEMNEVIVERHNNVVRTDDDVYILGDVAFTRNIDDIKDILYNMNGNKHLIFGNHDKIIRNNFDMFNDIFVWMKDYFELRYAKKSIMLFHFPIERWDKKQFGSINTHGHTHGTIQKENEGIRRIDVGLDCNSLYPFNILDIIEQCNIIPVKNDFKNIFHKNILKYCPASKPFSTVEEMNTKL